MFTATPFHDAVTLEELDAGAGNGSRPGAEEVIKILCKW
jgi:hypothetical protein